MKFPVEKNKGNLSKIKVFIENGWVLKSPMQKTETHLLSETAADGDIHLQEMLTALNASNDKGPPP